MTLRFDTGTDGADALGAGRCMSIERACREEDVFAGSLGFERALGAMSQDFFADIRNEYFRNADRAILLLIVLNNRDEDAWRWYGG